ncbi:MAG TPA: CbiX/SirB N-terminal domain-containing protein [Jiangellaceae bacterium]|nr:CbiX/SirB N-terminal domain-containing protein [Jiangellaceae bacterium]
MSGSAVLLVGHGSRHSSAAATVDTVARALAARCGLPVVAAHLEFSPPTPAEALIRLADAGHRDVVVVPLLFAPGHHVTVDVPQQIATAISQRPGLHVRTTGALLELPHAAEFLLTALDDRLAECHPHLSGDRAHRPFEALVLAAAGSSHPQSLSAFEDLAHRWETRRRLPVRAGYAAGNGPRVDEVTADLLTHRNQVAIGSLFLAPGRLPDRVRSGARRAGATTTADVIGAHPALIDVLTAAVYRSATSTQSPSACATATGQLAP